MGNWKKREWAVEQAVKVREVDSVEDVIEAARKLEDFVDEVDENEYHSRTS